MQFSGFQQGTLYTPVPNPIFGPLLEQIEDLAELKVTLRGLWLLHRKRGSPQLRALSPNELLNDRVLLIGLKASGKDPREEIRRGLQLAVARQTFLRYQPEPETPENQFYLLNTEGGRQSLARLKQGDGAALANAPAPGGDLMEAPADGKPNIFTLYENNVGMMTPMLAEELKEAEKLYPWDWIEDAFKIAVTQNKRSWSYVSGILRRWAAEGKDYGKPGRHSAKNDPKKYLEEYQRRRGRLPWERAGR